jgi:hypothetical protein
MKELNVTTEKDGSLTVNVESQTQNMDEKLAIATNSTFKYSSGSDVAKIFRAYGWKAPTTYRNDYLFKDNRLASGLSK